MKFEFNLTRGQVALDSIEENDVKRIVMEALNSVKKGNSKKAAHELFKLLKFEWSPQFGGGDPGEVFEGQASLEGFSFPLTDQNSTVKCGIEEGQLLLSATVQFELSVKPGITKEEVRDWLDCNSMYACGYISGGWSYSATDGDNIYPADE